MAEKTGREDSMADINIRKTIAEKGCALGVGVPARIHGREQRAPAPASAVRDEGSA